MTNLFADHSKIETWIDNDELVSVTYQNSFFIIQKNDWFKRLFFLSTNPAHLESDLEILLPSLTDEKMVTDLIGMTGQTERMVSIFTSRGFQVRSTLIRMSATKLTLNADSVLVNYADKKNLQVIQSYFEQYFDKYVEQIPTKTELSEWLSNNNIFCYLEDGVVAGFLIFENVQKTAYLRYWFVHPDYRNKNIGSKLMLSFHLVNSQASRFIFWVINTNENAIKRYLHYGFKKEELMDKVLTFNIQQDA